MQEIKSVFENQKRLFQENNHIAHMDLKPATLIRLHIFLEDCYADPLLRDDKMLLDFFKFERRLEIRKQQMKQRIRAEQM